VFVGHTYAKRGPLLLYVARADGSHVHLLTSFHNSHANCPYGGCDNTYPDWSPDGRWIVFQNGERRSALYVIHPDGSGLRLLVPAHAFTAKWSPDGKKVAFVRRGALYVVHRDGSHLRALLKGKPSIDAPAWQPRRAPPG
jgi:Tol biopolymer transport system component